MKHYFINLETSKIIAIESTNHVSARDQLTVGNWLHLTGEVITVETEKPVTKVPGTKQSSKVHE